MSRFKWFILPLILITLDAFSAPKGCQNLSECIDTVGKLTGTKYFYTEKFKGLTQSSNNVQLNKENADTILSLYLYENGYARIPIGTKEYKIISARDIRYQANPHFQVVNYDVSSIPDNHDFIMASVALKAPEASIEITKSLRPFLSRYGRVLGPNTGGNIILQDTGANIRRMIPIIADMDVKPSSETLETIKLNKQRQHEIELARAQNCKKQD